MADNLPAVSFYTPVEIVGIYRSFLERGRSNGIVWLRGIYMQRPNQNAQWSAFYDDLRDVNSNVTVTLKINRQDRMRLKPNSLIQVGGLIELNPFTNGTIQIVVNVTRFEIVKDQFVTEQDLKRTEIRVAKSKRGFKNVDALLEDKLFRDERPKVALVFATTSITMADFNAGVNAAAVKIDFEEHRQSFGNAATLSSFLMQLDQNGFDVIALIRGGGSGIESLDEIPVLQTISQMKTPFICAIGHVGEELFLKTIADKVAPTPNGLGQYFSEMVERVTAKRNNSRAALIEEVKKQFIKQIDESNKKNKDLLTQVEKLTKQSQEQTKTFNENMKKQQEENAKNLKKVQEENANNLKKLQEENKKNLEAQQKKDNEALAKVQAENKKNLDAIQAQNKQQMDSAKKQNADLQLQLQNLTKSQKENFDKLTEQNKETTLKLEKEQENNKVLQGKLAEAIAKNNNKTWMIVSFIALAVLLAILLFK